MLPTLCDSMGSYRLAGFIAMASVIFTIVMLVAFIVLAILTMIAQWKLHKILGCRWAWYIFFPVLNRIQILDLMKSEDDTIEVMGHNIPYHLVSLYEMTGSLVTVVLGLISLIPIIGGLIVTIASAAVIGLIGRYYNARVIALLYGESPDEYRQYLTTGFWWSVFPFLTFFWLKKNM